MKYFDMMYYYLATFYRRFFKKRSGWDLQSIFVINVTQTMLLFDLWMVLKVNILNIKGKLSTFEKVSFYVLGFALLYFNIKKYEKKYLHHKQVWGVYHGGKKAFFTFITFFTVVFAWCFILIVGYMEYLFNK